MCFQVIINHSIEPSFLVTLIHSEDVCSEGSAHLHGPSCLHHLTSSVADRGDHRGLWMCVLTLLPSCWNESTDKLVCMWDCFSLFNLFIYFFNYLLVYKRLYFVINLFRYWIAVSEFWMSPVVCTQITAKRLSLLVTRKQKPDLFLNGLGKAQNMQER